MSDGVWVTLILLYYLAVFGIVCWAIYRLIARAIARRQTNKFAAAVIRITLTDLDSGEQVAEIEEGHVKYTSKMSSLSSRPRLPLVIVNDRSYSFDSMGSAGFEKRYGVAPTDSLRHRLQRIRVVLKESTPESPVSVVRAAADAADRGDMQGVKAAIARVERLLEGTEAGASDVDAER
jgi:hypothetical protein